MNLSHSERIIICAMVAVVIFLAIALPDDAKSRGPLGSVEGVDWRPGYPKGTFAQPIPRAPEGARLVVGRFEETLPTFKLEKPPLSLVHIDCDLTTEDVQRLINLMEIVEETIRPKGPDLNALTHLTNALESSLKYDLF